MSQWVGTDRTFDPVKAVYDPTKDFTVEWTAGNYSRIHVATIKDLHNLFVSVGGWPLIVDFREDAETYDIVVYNGWIE